MVEPMERVKRVKKGSMESISVYTFFRCWDIDLFVE